jgi:hypothetical protein
MKTAYRKYLRNSGHGLIMEFLENHGHVPDPKSGQFLWEV